MLDEFGWGREFIKLNKELLELYRTSADADEVVKRQNDWLKEVEAANGKAGAGHLFGKKKNKTWGKEDSDEEEGSEEQDEEEIPAFGRGEMGELPPSDDEYEEYYSDDAEPKMDKFGNYIVDEDDSNDEPKMDKFGNYIVDEDDSDEEPKMDKFGNYIVDDDNAEEDESNSDEAEMSMKEVGDAIEQLDT